MEKVIEDDEYLYYYTSNYVLLQWLKSEKLWATRSVSSNDARDTNCVIDLYGELEKLYPEYKSAFEQSKMRLEMSKNFSLRVYKDILRDYIKNHFDEYEYIVSETYKKYKYIKNNKDRLVHKYFKDDKNLSIEGEKMLFEEILKRLNNDEITKYFGIKDIENFKKMIPRIPDFKYPYVICFTKNKDDRFLWDSYTGNRGVSLVFSRKKLESYLNEKKYSEQEIRRFSYLADIRYCEDDQKKFIKENIEDAIKTGDGMFWMYKSDLIDSQAVFCKPEYWEPENECRAVFMETYFGAHIFEVKENYDLKYNNGYKTQDYIEISIPKELVQGIIVGPINSKKELQKEVHDNFSDRGEIIRWFDNLYINNKVEDSVGHNLVKDSRDK